MPLPHPKADKTKIRAAFDALPYDVTLRDVAARMGVTPMMAGNYRAGNNVPTAKRLPALAKALGVSESDLLTD